MDDFYKTFRMLYCWDCSGCPNTNKDIDECKTEISDNDDAYDEYYDWY